MVVPHRDVHGLQEIDLVILGMHGTGSGGMGWGGGMGWMMWLLLILFWLLILVALAGGVYWMFSRLFSDNSPAGSESEASTGNPSREALRHLDERYARGEIDDEEYTRRKRKIVDEDE
jgi:putative membrane protein